MEIPLLHHSDQTVFPNITADMLGEIHIRRAKVGDVHGMSALINYYASNNVMLARGPQYLFQHLQDYIVATSVRSDTGNECVVGCAALNILWGDLAEIRSLAVHHACQHKGLGAKIITNLIARCKDLDIPRVFCFTLVDKFFSSCGFTAFNRDLLPPIVWAECSKCPKFYNCDEISMMYTIQNSPTL